VSITKALNKTFAPEFINRIDEIVNFDQLEMDSLIRIVDIELKQTLWPRFRSGIHLTDDRRGQEVPGQTRGYDVQYGARPLKRAIQQYVEDALSEVILSGTLQPGDTILAEVKRQPAARTELHR